MIVQVEAGQERGVRFALGFGFFFRQLHRCYSGYTIRQLHGLDEYLPVVYSQGSIYYAKVSL